MRSHGVHPPTMNPTPGPSSHHPYGPSRPTGAAAHSHFAIEIVHLIFTPSIRCRGREAGLIILCFGGVAECRRPRRDHTSTYNIIGPNSSLGHVVEYLILRPVCFNSRVTTHLNHVDEYCWGVFSQRARHPMTVPTPYSFSLHHYGSIWAIGTASHSLLAIKHPDFQFLLPAARERGRATYLV